MNRILLLVGIGGFIGSVLRFYSQQVVSKYFPSTLPYGTLAVNIAGCFFVGVIYALSEKGNILNPEWRIFLATGLCGGFTTFSTFSYETINLIKGGEWFYASVYVAFSVVIGLYATYLGILLIKFL